jgi:hypothetical protein
MTEQIAWVQGAQDEGPLDVQHQEDEAAAKERERQIAEYRERGQQFLEAHAGYFQSFAGDASLQFKLSDGFYIDLEKGIVNLDASWFWEQGFDERQIVWACLHELSHFGDLADDPAGLRGGFTHIRERARATGDMLRAKWADVWGATYPEVLQQASEQVPVDEEDPTKGTMDRFQQMAYRFHHGFFNALDDIHVNGRVSRRALSYDADAPDGQRIRALYREKLFKETDYSTIPRHLQFEYALLRRVMVPDEAIVVTPEVQALLDSTVSVEGAAYTVTEVVDRFIRPRSVTDTRASARYAVIKETLEKIFLDLLAKDLEEWKPPEPKKTGGGGGKGKSSGSGKGAKGQAGGEQPQQPAKPNPGGGPGKPGDKPAEGDDDDGDGPVIEGPWSDDYKKHGKRTPDHIDDKDREKFRAAAQKKKEDEEKNKERLLREAQDREFCKREHVTQSQLDRYRTLMAEVEPYLKQLSAVWDRIIGSGGTSVVIASEGGYTRGKLDVGETIRQWPRIATGGIRDARVMRRMVERTKEDLKPELIRVRLVCDQSGSMFMDHGEKMRTLERSLVLVLASLNEFQTKLNGVRRRFGTKLEVDTEVTLFGDEPRVIKELRTRGAKSTDTGDIVRSFAALGADLGGTDDASALQRIRETYDAAQRSAMQDGRVRELVIEITDGGSTSEGDTPRQAVDELIADGAVARAIQIGAVHFSERARFAEVWIDGRPAPLGEAIGTDFSKLPEALTKLLSEFLGDVRI